MKRGSRIYINKNMEILRPTPALAREYLLTALVQCHQ
jgi:hypothetical protein